MQYLKTLYFPALALLAITACALPLEHTTEGKPHNSSIFHARTDFHDKIVISAPDRNAITVPSPTEESSGHWQKRWLWVWPHPPKPRQDDVVVRSEDKEKALWTRTVNPENWCWRHVCKVISRDQMQGPSELNGWSFPQDNSNIFHA